MKQFFVMQLSSAFWAAIFCTFVSWLGATKNDIIDAKSLILRDNDGRKRIVLGCAGLEQSSAILLLDKKSNTVFAAGAGDSSTSITMCSDAESPAIKFECNKDLSSFSLTEQVEMASVHMSVSEGQPRVIMCNQDGNPQIGASVAPDGAKLVLGRSSGFPNFAALINDFGLSFFFQGESASQRSQIRYDSATEKIDLINSDGVVLESVGLSGSTKETLWSNDDCQ